MRKKPTTNFAKAAAERLAEAGRVLSAANEARLQTAVATINEVLSQLQVDDGTDAAATEAKRKLAEAWSASAWDASCGAEILSDLVELMGEESDEPEQFALLKAAFDGLNAWIAAEVGEIGQPDDAGDSSMVLFDYEAMRARRVRESDVVALREGAVGADGKVHMKIIQPGWGTSGYYSAAVLERDGPQIFKAGTKNFWDHPTLTEEVDRPERTLRDLAGELVSDARWEAAGPEGPGLYADATVRSDFAPAVNEMAPYIGVSIRALGTAHNGTVEGQSGPIIDKLLAAESIDYVTTPGAGGRVMQLFEAARRREQIKPKEATEEVDLAEATRLQEENKQLREDNARKAEILFLNEARGAIKVALAKFEDLPAVTAQRLEESLAKAAQPTAEGKPDEAAISEAVEAAVKAEAEYLASATGSGAVRGFGTSAPSEGDETIRTDKLAEAMRGLGLSDGESKIAAKGR